jgi:hypothetical protein
MSGCAAAVHQPEAGRSRPSHARPISRDGNLSHATAVARVSQASGAGHGSPARPIVTKPFAVVLGRGARAQIVNMVTRRVVGSVPPPLARTGFVWVAAGTDDRTFALADEASAAVIRFYLLHLAKDGKPDRLTPIPGPVLRAAEIYGMALTADASELAVAWQNEPTGRQVSRVLVIPLAGGRTRTWASAAGAATYVSWAGDHTLVFDWQEVAGQARSGIRLLDTAAPGTNPMASRLVVPASARFDGLNSPGDPVITQDGSWIFASMATGPSGASTVLVKFSARTGRPVLILTRPVSSAGPGGVLLCGVLRADRTGQHLVTQCGASQRSISGARSRPIRLYRPRRSPVGWANTFAW